uniref:Uncharacterized protein n=1 Tax=Arundo donax TaxID=35708 RepID=A0A0A9G5E7_ARUDO
MLATASSNRLQHVCPYFGITLLSILCPVTCALQPSSLLWQLFPLRASLQLLLFVAVSK